MGLLYLLLQVIARIPTSNQQLFPQRFLCNVHKIITDWAADNAVKNHKYNKINTKFVIHTWFDSVTMGTETSSASARSMVELPT
jgi:hypothetical protein